MIVLSPHIVCLDRFQSKLACTKVMHYIWTRSFACYKFRCTSQKLSSQCQSVCLDRFQSKLACTKVIHYIWTRSFACYKFRCTSQKLSSQCQSVCKVLTLWHYRINANIKTWYTRSPISWCLHFFSPIIGWMCITFQMPLVKHIYCTKHIMTWYTFAQRLNIVL